METLRPETVTWAAAKLRASFTTLRRDWGGREDLADIYEEFGGVADDVFRAAVLRVRRRPDAPSNLVGALTSAVRDERRERNSARTERRTDRLLAAPKAEDVDPDVMAADLASFFGRAAKEDREAADGRTDPTADELEMPIPDTSPAFEARKRAAVERLRAGVE